MKKQFGEYYLGLDMGTDSLGWAVTDLNYNILRFNGKSMWGTHLFDSGLSAEERRLFRTTRRRGDRRCQRIALLQELFNAEIAAVDIGFFQRLSDSKFWADDKDVEQLNTLFNDSTYSDADYHKEFPTVFHLRKAIIEQPDRKFDIRLIYLSIAHILKNRGHFLLHGQEFKASSAFSELYSEFVSVMYDTLGLDYTYQDINKIEEILKMTASRTYKKKLLSDLLGKESKAKIEFISLLVGGSSKLNVLFCDDTYKECDVPKIQFSKADYADNEDKYLETLGDRMDCINAAKAIYDWALLSEVLCNQESISNAKVLSYEKHKADLKLLKRLIKNECSKNVYDEMFRDEKQQANYCAYIGSSKVKENKSTCSREEFFKYTASRLKGIDAENPDLKYVIKEIENGSFMPKQITGDNGVIPYQLHLEELKAILSNSAVHYPFLDEADGDGVSISEKISSIMTFRIPYYVGPLNDAHSGDAQHGHSWVVKKSIEPVRPWNFKKIVDLDASGERFIMRMTSKCSYLIGADVLPKDSLLYSKFMVLNEINSLRINGEKIDVETKQGIVENICKKKTRVRNKDIRDFLISTGKMGPGDEISGIDGDLKASLKSHIELHRIIEDFQWDDDKAEECIKTIVLFGEEKSIVRKRISAIYGDVLTAEQIKKICSLKYSGWGRLSKELLTEIYHADFTTGEAISIISALYNTNENLMRLLSGDYDYSARIKEHNAATNGAITEFTYDKMVGSLYCSPAIKRGIWRTLTVVKEIEKITGHPPKKIFVEVAREDGEKKRTISRKNALLELYNNCGEEGRQWAEELADKTDGELRSDKLYLYYTQMGRCMYSGDTIELSDLFNDNLYDVDHIFPQSKTKDDSIENRVLVKKKLNKEKEDQYPVPAKFRIPATLALWNRLFKMGLIGKIKYDRLMRTEGFSLEELSGFINRQLVETRQSTKAVAEALAKLYSENKTEVVYVKARNVSAFRQANGFVKVREINDFHHAKDAYLNIVVGNVYNTKFTKDPRNFIKTATARSYSLNKMYDFDVERGDVVAWRKGETGTIEIIRKQMSENRIQFTRYSYQVTGAFYDQMPMKKGHGQIPLKGNDSRMANISRYGGYNKESGAYFILVEHLKKGKLLRSIEYIPVRFAKEIEEKPQMLENYCKSAKPFGLELEQPRILIQKIKVNTLFNIDGFPMHISGRTGDAITFKAAAQLCLDEESERYIKKLVNYNERRRQNANPPSITVFDSITKEENLKIYDVLLDKHRDTIYSRRPSQQITTMVQGREKFIELSVEKQAMAILNILVLFKCVFATTDLKLIGGSGQAGMVTKNKVISSCKKATITYQSHTGLFSNTVDLLTI